LTDARRANSTTRRATARPFPRLLVAIWLIQAVIGVGFALSMPLWQDHEADFFNVARFLNVNHRLPVPADYADGDADIRQATQPVLYFLLSAPLVGLFDDGAPTPPGIQPLLICPGGANEAAVRTLTTAAYDFPPQGAALAGYALRLLGVAMALIAVGFMYATARRLFPAYPSAALLSAALLAFEPTLARQSAIISNDVLLLAVAAANLYAVARLLTGKVTLATRLPIAATAALAALTRLPGWAVMAFDGSVLALVVIGRALGQPSGRQRRALLLAGVSVVGLIALAFGIGAFNLARYGSVLGRYDNLDQIVLNTLRDFRLPVVTLVGIFDQTWHDSMNLMEALRPRAILARLYGWLPAVLIVLALAGTALAFLRRTDRTTRQAFGVLWLAAGIAAGLVIVRNITIASDANTTLYNTSFIFAPLRYYLPGLPAFALLVGMGAALILPASPTPLSRRAKGERAAAIPPLDMERGRGGAVLLLIALPFLIVGALSVARIAAETPPDPVVPRAAGMTRAAALIDGASPQLLGYETDSDGSSVAVTLIVTTDVPLNANFIPRVTLGGAASCEFAPLDGAYPSTRWTPGDAIRVPLRVPYCPLDAAPLDAGAPIVLSWLTFDADGALIPVESPPTFSLGVTAAPLTRAPSCPDSFGVIGGAYQITKFNAPPPVRRGETVVPSLNWFVTTPNPDASARIFVFRHAATGYETTCNVTTRYAAAWVRGERFYFDGCPMQFTSDAPTGIYTVLVGIQDAAFAYLPAVDADGNAATLIPVGTMEIMP